MEGFSVVIQGHGAPLCGDFRLFVERNTSLYASDHPRVIEG